MSECKQYVEVEAKAYVVKDSFGNTNYDVVVDSSDNVCICGMKTKANVSVYFESEAWHLKGWCEDYGFSYKEVPMFIQVEI